MEFIVIFIIVLNDYCISLIDTTSSISTSVWYNLSIDNTEIVVIFINSIPSNSTSCHFVTLTNYHVTTVISLIAFKL